MKFILIKLAKYLMIPVGVVYTVFCRVRCPVILLYHRVNDCIKKEMAVKTSNFRWQMDYLRRKGYRVISLDQAIRMANMMRTAELKKTVVLTFDDGYEDYYTEAFPVLMKCRYPSINYLASGFVESGRVFPWDADIGFSNLMIWDQIKDLSSSGLAEFGSHTVNHPELNKLNDMEAEQELSLSKDTIERKLERSIEHFSYPKGIVTQFEAAAAGKIYKSAVSIFDGNELADGARPDNFCLRRLPVQRSDGRYLFIARLKGWLEPEAWAKRLIGRR
jgi:peptidoglycan/xylan/chitin deacetylase (PgdA/CDA1 family)